MFKLDSFELHSWFGPDRLSSNNNNYDDGYGFSPRDEGPSQEWRIRVVLKLMKRQEVGGRGVFEGIKTGTPLQSASHQPARVTSSSSPPPALQVSDSPRPPPVSTRWHPDDDVCVSGSPPEWRLCGSSPSPCWSYWWYRGPGPEPWTPHSTCAALTWSTLSTWSVETEASSTTQREMWTPCWVRQNHPPRTFTHLSWDSLTGVTKKYFLS